MDQNKKKAKVCINGYTLIEMIVAIFVFSMVSGALFLAIVMIYRTEGYSTDQAIAVNEARRGVDIMAEEIRKARYGEDGSYPIEMGAGKEFIFYSDIDNDGDAERVRYFLATVNAGAETKNCVTTATGGSCSVTFSGFLSGTLKSAQAKISTEGYYGTPSRYARLYVDGTNAVNMCASGCVQCAGAWQGTQTLDVTSYAADGTVQFTLSGTNSVKNQCSWQTANHSLQAMVELSWVEEIPSLGDELKKGVIQPEGSPATYPDNQEKISVITSYVRNAPPIFTYYDAGGNQITSDPSILTETKMMRLFMVINVDVNRAPDDYDLEQYVQLRNLKE